MGLVLSALFLSLWLLCSKERTAGTGSGTAAVTGGHHREAWTTKGPSYEDLYTQNVVISMEDQEDVNRSASEGKPARERPIWLRESTVQGAYDPDEIKDGKKIHRAEVLLCLCDARNTLPRVYSCCSQHSRFCQLPSPVQSTCGVGRCKESQLIRSTELFVLLKC